MSRYRGKRRSDGTLTFVAAVLVCIIAMPIAGLYFLLRRDPSKRGLGWVLLIAGGILWVLILTGG